MKKTVIILVFILVSSKMLYAQYLDVEWEKRQGGSGDDIGVRVLVDASGNIFTCGYFSGTVDFDPGPAVYNLTASGLNAVFISKFNAAGNLLWAKKMGGGSFSTPLNMVMDAAGSIYIAGFFYANIDLDPGPAIYNLTSFGDQDIFIVKLDPSGNFAWGKQIGGTQKEDYVSIKTGNSGEVYVTGCFNGTADMDPGPGIYNLTSFGSWDTFVTKLDASGNFLWAKQIGGTSYDFGYSTDLDGAGVIYISGSFSGTSDFDPGPGIYNLTANGFGDAFICKLDAAGNFLWAKQIKGNGIDQVGTHVYLDGSGNIFLKGYFYGTTDFDPGPGIYNLTSFGGSDVFICKLDNAGNFVWVKQIGGTGPDNAESFKKDNAGNIYLTGYFNGTADFDPGPGNYNLTSFGNWDIFVEKLDPSGNFIWAKQMGGPGYDYGISLDVDNPGNVYVTGYFNTMAVFNPCDTSGILTSAGNTDIFTMKLNVKTASVSITSSDVTVCEGSPVTFTATAIDAGQFPSFQWQVNGSNVGTNSPTYTTSSLVNGDVVRVIISSPCIGYVPVISNSISITVTPLAIPSVSIIASSNVICEGTPVSFTAISTNGGAMPVYQWQVNGFNVGTNSTNYVANNLVNGDNVRVLISSSGTCITPGAFSSNTITITVNPKETPIVSIATFPATICYGTMVTVQALPVNGGNRPSYQWRLNGSPAGSNRSSFITSSLVDGDTIDCIMTSNYYCLSKTADTSNKIVIKIDPTVCPIGFYMPTAFTPNNDGLNDFCRPLLFGKVISYRFSLYNRWGQRIFETTDLQKGWDGKISGVNQDTNIFAWMCSFQFQNQPAETRKGTVVLIR